MAFQSKQNFITAYIFPVTTGPATQKLMFGLYVTVEVSAMTFLCCHTLLCFAVTMMQVTYIRLSFAIAFISNDLNSQMAFILITLHLHIPWTESRLFTTIIALSSCNFTVLIVCYHVFPLKLHYPLITLLIIRTGLLLHYMYTSSDMKSNRMTNLRAAASCTHSPCLTEPEFKRSIDVKTRHRNCVLSCYNTLII